MIDIKKIKQDIAWYKDVLTKRNLKINLDEFLSLDNEKNKISVELDALRNIKNMVSKEIPNLSGEEKEKKISEMKNVWEKISLLEEKLSEVVEKHTYILHRLPNFLDETTAIGKDESESVAESFFLEPTKFDFSPKTHYEIGEKKGWIDLEKGAEIAGARFWYLKGNLALLNMAIIQYAIHFLVEKGFEFFIPPYMVKEKALFGTGFLPAGEDWVYAINPWEDDLYLIGTAEIPLTSYYMGEVIDVEKPKLSVGYSPCFRREAGSYGKDMKWILRGHQFEKVEMVVFCKPEDSKKIHDMMVGIEEELWQSLKIPYRKVNICSGDLWNPALKKYDLEAWLPGQENYREVTSCSNMGEFQSRRLGIKYRKEDGNLEYVHTLNGTVVALTRCLIAVIENYQTKEWDINIPEVLKPYMGGKEKI
jgi:seryl-tRNA synthetase